jgi:spermidine synthase
MSSATPKITNARRAAGAAAARRSAQRVTALALALFFLSGASSLIYEVAWVRLLSLAFGVSVYAVSTVLSVFMGGLALGSWLYGRRATRSPRIAALAQLDVHPALLLYAALQAGIGVYALLTPALFSGLTGLYAWVGRGAALGPTSAAILRIALAALALLVPTVLMGGTLPALSQFLAREPAARGRTIGNLYAINTLGAVLGTLAAGLLLIRFVGTSAAIYAAALIDLLVAAAAIWWLRGMYLEPQPGLAPAAERAGAARPSSRKGKRAATHSQPGDISAVQAAAPSSAPNARQRRLILAGYGLSGFAALGYQVVWTRLLAIFTLNAVFSFTIMLATFLAGLALGSALMSRRIDRVQRPLALFGALQLAIGLCGVLVLFVFAKLPTLVQIFASIPDYVTALGAELFTAAITLLLPTLLIGATFPVAARVLGSQPAAQQNQELDTHDSPERGSVGDGIGRLYAVNTLGAMLGSLVAGFVLIPTIGMQHSALALATLNLAIGALTLLAGQPAGMRSRRAIGGVGATIAAAAVAAALLPPGFYLGFREGATSQLIFYKEGVDATVAVFEVKQPPLKVSFVNGRNEVPTDAQSMRAFYVLGHLPALLRPNAQQALMVSFGNGIATGAMARHHIPHIQAVELVEGQVEAAQLYSAENRHVLDNPAVQIAHEDGRNVLLRSPVRYDIITADATHPINTSSWALFTHEFYGLVRQHLADDGVFIQWLPFHDLASQDFRDIVKTFQSTFPHTSLWYTGGPHTFLVATPQPLTRADVLGLDARLADSAAGADLGDSRKLASDLLMEEDAVMRYTAGARVVTDDNAFFLPAKDADAILESFVPYAQAGQGQP